MHGRTNPDCHVNGACLSETPGNKSRTWPSIKNQIDAALRVTLQGDDAEASSPRGFHPGQAASVSCIGGRRKLPTCEGRIFFLRRECHKLRQSSFKSAGPGVLHDNRVQISQKKLGWATCNAKHTASRT